MDWYQVCLRVFASLPLISPLLFKVDAPHGRFNSTNHDSSEDKMKKWKVARIFSTPSLNVNGTVAWILMELPSPTTLLVSFNKVYPVGRLLDLGLRGLDGPRILVGLYLVHYLNRAVISPLRTPSRSPSHIIVPLAAVAFNLLNGFLMGTYLGSLSRLIGDETKREVALDTGFWVCVGAAAIGLASNLWHDEVLLNLRKKKDKSPDSSHSAASNGSTSSSEREPPHRQASDPSNRYQIPFGGLYRFVSYPNYLSEWCEWAAFAAASTYLASNISKSLSSAQPFESLGLGPSGIYTPPWLFVAAEVAVMLPRAVRGHQWYQDKFGLRYPPERKAVIPLLL